MAQSSMLATSVSALRTGGPSSRGEVCLDFAIFKRYNMYAAVCLRYSVAETVFKKMRL